MDSAASVRVLIAPDYGQRLADDHQIEHQRPVAYVVDVVLDAGTHLVEGFGFAAQAVDLGPAGDAGFDLVPQHVALDEFAVLLVVRDRMGTRADDAHAALQDVDELGQLVERGFADERAERGNAAIATARLPDAVAVLANPHGAEFVDHDFLPVEPVATLLENDRAGRGELHADGDGDQDRPDQEQDEACDDDIADALADAGHAQGGRLGQRDDGHAVDVIDARLNQVGHEDVRYEIDRSGGVAQRVEQRERARLRSHGQGDVDQVDGIAIDVFRNVGQLAEQFPGIHQLGARQGPIVEEADDVDPQGPVAGEAPAQFGAEVSRTDDDGASPPPLKQQQARQYPAHYAVRHPHRDGRDQHPRHDQVRREPFEIAGGKPEQQDQPRQEEPGHDDLVPEGAQVDLGPFAGKREREDDERQDRIRAAEGLVEIDRAADQDQHGHQRVKQNLGQGDN